MTSTLAARNVKLYDLRTKFNLQRTENVDFFLEWRERLSPLTGVEEQTVDRLKTNYLYLLEHPGLESIVKMVVLSPLPDLAGFYASPFRVTAEESVQVEAQDGDERIQGDIDVLVLQEQLWVTVIEAKNSEFSLTKAIPQCLAYMLANPDSTNPLFGGVTNGSEFLSLKLVSSPICQYALSDTFSLLNQGNDYHQVLQILKRLGRLLSLRE
jgi:hypothetical protein